jgi:hypothetical protein
MALAKAANHTALLEAASYLPACSIINNTAAANHRGFLCQGFGAMQNERKEA